MLNLKQYKSATDLEASSSLLGSSPLCAHKHCRERKACMYTERTNYQTVASFRGFLCPPHTGSGFVPFIQCVQAVMSIPKCVFYLHTYTEVCIPHIPQLIWLYVVRALCLYLSTCITWSDHSHMQAFSYGQKISNSHSQVSHMPGFQLLKS